MRREQVPFTRTTRNFHLYEVSENRDELIAKLYLPVTEYPSPPPFIIVELPDAE